MTGMNKKTHTERTNERTNKDMKQENNRKHKEGTISTHARETYNKHTNKR